MKNNYQSILPSLGGAGGGLCALLFVLFLLTSCYKIIRTVAPKTAEAGSTIEVSFTVVDDGSDTQNFVTDWSYGR